ncbi:MAG: prepilin-type N-terminal cleavage/methylation domain-containing protein [Verrucomicrobiales bacterium]
MTPRQSPQSRRSGGFTVIELITVIAIILILAALTIGLFKYVQYKASAEQARGYIAAIETALERYKGEYGNYPEPIEGATVNVNGKQYDIAGAKCLYQALTGDGSDAIKGVGGSASNGESEDGEQIFWKKIAPGTKTNLVAKDGESNYYLVDPFGVPFQYRTAIFDEDGEMENEDEMHNSTYDIWSYGKDTTGTDEVSWIKNW